MNGARTIQKRKRLAEYDYRTDECRQERERYAAEGPQLSVADRKFVGIARRPFIVSHRAARSMHRRGHPIVR